MKYHSAFHTKNAGSCSYFASFQIPQFAFSETEIKPQPKFSQLIPASLAPSHALFILQRFWASCFKIPQWAAKLVHQNSPSAKGPLRHPVDGQVFCKSFKSSPVHTYFQPWASPSYSKNTPKWLCLIVFSVFSALIKTYSGKRGLVALAAFWAGELQEQLCKQSLFVSYNMPLAVPVLLRAQNEKEETKPKNHKPCQSPSWSTWASPSCSEPGCPKQEHKNIT